MRNEIKDRQSNSPVIIEESKQRQQRVSLILKDVEYVIAADMALVWKGDGIVKYRDQFRRKLERGACHHTPYLGTREFAAWFEPATGDETPEVIIDSQYLGVMLFDTAYVKSESRPDLRFLRHKSSLDGSQKRVPPEVHQGYQHYLFFPARIENSQIVIPAEKYRELYELEGLHV